MSTPPPPPPGPPPPPAPPPPPGAAAQPGYPTQPGSGYAPDHPRATVALVLGILGIVVCQVVAPFAMVIGRRAVKEIDASNGTIGGRGSARAGYILGIIGTVLLALGLLIVIVAIIAAAASSS